MSLATNTAYGEIKLAGDLAGGNDANSPTLTNTAVTPGTYTLPTLTINSKGQVTAASNGTSASVLALIPDATTSTKGIASIGTGLVVTSGAVSVPDATTSTKGILKYGSGLTLSGGALIVDVTALPDATTSVRGVATVGEGLQATAGVISIAPATTSLRGGLAIGSGLSVDGSGVVSVAASLPAATSSVPGAVTSADTNNIVITAGAIDVGPNVAKLNTFNTFTKSQVVAKYNATYAASMTLDFSLGNVQQFTATGNFTMNTPTNAVAGGTYIIIVLTGATNVTPTWGSAFKWAPNATKICSALSGKYDIFTMVAIASNSFLVTSQIGF